MEEGVLVEKVLGMAGIMVEEIALVVVGRRRWRWWRMLRTR